MLPHARLLLASALVVFLGCASKADHPPPAGSSGAVGTSGGASGGTSGAVGDSGASGGVPKDLPDSRNGGCAWTFQAHTATTMLASTASLGTVCGSEGRIKFTWADHDAANGLVTTQTEVDVLLPTDLAVNRFTLQDVTVIHQENEMSLGDGGKQFAKNQVWRMPTGACVLVVNLREYFGIKSSPSDYRYDMTISCTEAAAPVTLDAQPSSVTIDQLRVSTTLTE